jgi:hypothetical protein
MSCSGAMVTGSMIMPALRALDLVDFAGLLVDGEVAMDDAEAALLGHGDGHAGFGDGIHGGAESRGVVRGMLFVRRVRVLTCAGATSLHAGVRRTSSNVRASARGCSIMM